MDKVGIITLSAAENFGASLQSYSLCNYLNENGIETELIDYTPEFLKNRYNLFFVSMMSIKSFFKSIIASIVNLPIAILKKIRFKKFKKYTQYSQKKYDDNNITDDYIKYLVGSDQVWNMQLTHNNEVLFLNFCAPQKKNSYAASLGIESLNDEQKLLIKNALLSFQNISIREKIGQEIVKSIIGTSNINRNIDPVFLHDKEYWLDITNDKKNTEKYALVYSFKSEKRAIEIAYKLGYKNIYSLKNSMFKTDKRVKNIVGAGPREFLAAISNADYIITDSFHGIAFSIIFEKNFYPIEYEGTSSRMKELYRLFDIKIDDKRYCAILDYAEVEKVIIKERQKSLIYLKNIL